MSGVLLLLKVQSGRSKALGTCETGEPLLTGSPALILAGMECDCGGKVHARAGGSRCRMIGVPGWWGTKCQVSCGKGSFAQLMGFLITEQERFLAQSAFLNGRAKS